MDECVKNMWGICVYTHIGILLSHKNEWNVICDSIGRTWGYVAKWNKSDRERQILFDLTYIWHIRNKNYM